LVFVVLPRIDYSFLVSEVISGVPIPHSLDMSALLSREYADSLRGSVAAIEYEVEVVEVSNYGAIMTYGIMSTPGLVVDGKVVSYGRVPSAGDIALWLSE
jgi:hypothetical protein